MHIFVFNGMRRITFVEEKKTALELWNGTADANRCSCGEDI